MGMFRRIAKETARNAEAQSRLQEFDDSLRLQLQGFEAGLNPSSPYFERASDIEYLKKLVSASEKKRDAATKLNLHGYAAAFSTIHCRTFIRLNEGVLIGDSQPQVTFGLYGCRELHSLHSDIRYLAWGVDKAGVDPREYWDCKDMVDQYLQRIIDFAITLVESGNIQIVNDFNFPATKELVSWSSYKQLLYPPTNFIVPNVPPVQR